VTAKRERHLDTRLALDFLEQRLEASERHLVEDHLGKPCPACRERLRLLGEILDTMRADRAGEVPAQLHRIATEVFVPIERPSVVKQMADVIAELLFDSAAQPLTAAARRSVGEARRLRFLAGGHTVDLEIEREGANRMSVRGHLDAPDAQLWSLGFNAGAERRVLHADAHGRFVVDGLPHETLHLVLDDGVTLHRLPPIEP
jgi:hypothetical protein